MPKKVVVIGGGFGGLAAAALLGQKGYKVTLLEKNSQVGGRATTWKKDGFLFDLGPSWYLMPDVFVAFFARFGKKPADYYQLERLDPAYRIFFESGRQLDVSPKFTTNQKLFDTLETGGGAKLKDYLTETEHLYSTAMKQFVYKPFEGLSSVLDPKLLKNVNTLRKISTSFDKFVGSYFSSDEAKKILEYAVVFLGGSPQNTPAFYSILSYVDMKLGVWYPRGGFANVIGGLAKLAREQGVKIHSSHEVTGFRFAGNSIDSVNTPKGIFAADIVVSGADYQHVDQKLLPADFRQYSGKSWQSRTLAPSAMLIYVGINRKLKKLAHHNLYLATDWNRHFSQIFDSPKWPDNPSYYVCASSKTDPTVAPKGSENIFFLVPVAAGLADSDSLRATYANKIITHFETLIGEKIASNIQVKRIFTHRDFATRYHAFQGTALGLAHTLRQTAFLRPRHKSTKLTNLYHCGHYTHPGVGTAPALISGEIVADMIGGVK
jgi:phytoene desaturase